MRKNVKKQLALRVLSTAALMAMVSSIATAAFAEEYDLNKGSVTVETKDNGNTYVTQANTETTDHLDTTGVTITSNGDPTSNTITVETAKDQTTNVTLENVHIETKSSWNDSGSAPIEIKGNGDTNLELNGNNIVLSGNKNHAGIEKADVNGTGTLTIKDDVNDDGKLLAGGYEDSAGIGGGSYHDGKSYGNTSNITITGGDITAVGGVYGAGIGGGSDEDASNIRIEGNAHVAAFSNSGAGIGSGYFSNGNSDITITDHATVEAASLEGCGIGGSRLASGKATITISGNASVKAEALDSAAAIGSEQSSATVNIEDNAAVTAVSHGVAIGTSYGHEYNGGTSTVINITGGTVNAVTRDESRPAIGTVYGNLDLTINSSTGKTTVNACTTSSDPLSLNIGTGHYDSSAHKYRTSPSEGAEYNEDGSSNLGEDNAAIINFYRNTTLSTDTDTSNAHKTLDDFAFHGGASHTLSGKDKDKGDLYKVVHNRKYMEEHPEIVDDINKLENSDLHDWQLVGEVVEPTLEKDGYADYVCRIDKCGQTKRVVLPKLTPEESGSVETREVGVIFWDAAAQAAPAALQGKVLSADEQTTTAAKAQVESLLADKANWKLAEDVGDLMIHPAADAAGTVYEQAVKASGCQYYVIANVTAQ